MRTGYQRASEEEVENRGFVLDELGGIIRPPLPYIDYRYHPPKWFGEPLPMEGSRLPKCPKCGGNDGVRLIYPPHIDSDGVYNRGLYYCSRCRMHF